MDWPWNTKINYLRDRIQAVHKEVLDMTQQLQAIPTSSVSGEDLAEFRAQLSGIEAELDAHAKRFKDLTMAIEEGIERVDRAENRIKATVTRAQRKYPDDPSISAEAEELRERDALGGGEGRVPPVPEVLEDGGGEADGWSEAAYMANLKFRGLM